MYNQELSFLFLSFLLGTENFAFPRPLSKAFDSLFPPLQLAKLKEYGFSDSALIC